jgi:cytochrome P450/NADPH-cytochrome P450 reductase
MKEPGFNVKGSFDFLTQLLNDEMYMNDDKMMMDECMTFIGAATQTTTFLLSNVVYYMMKNPEVLAKARAEIKTNLFSRLPKGASLTEDGVWENLLLSEENTDSLPYLLQCIYETLRIESSATISSAVRLTETLPILDKTIRSDTPIMIGIHRLHTNPD